MHNPVDVFIDIIMFLEQDIEYAPSLCKIPKLYVNYLFKNSFRSISWHNTDIRH